MTANKKTVALYIESFKTSSHEKILSCLTDDVVWEMPGLFYLTGKAAFGNKIANDHFIGNPQIEISSLTEEDDIVVAEGSVKCDFRTGDLLDAAFCDVFRMEKGKIKRLTSYQMNR